ncbi:MAG: tetratricopeptide repeat protein [Polyangiales bacterium]
MTRQPSRLLVLPVLLSVAFAARAHAQSVDKVGRALTEVEAKVDQLKRAPIQRSQLRSPTYVEERLTDGELFFRLQDYLRASVIFTDIVDNYPQHRAYPDALFLLAESLFKAGDFLGARERYRAIIAHADQAAYQSYVQRSLGRLIEIAIHIQDFTGVDEYFTRLSKLPPSEVEAATNYFRAKYLYSVAIRDAESPTGSVTQAKADPQGLEQARLAFEAVAARSPYYTEALYFIGVIYVLRGQLDAAVDAFRRVAAVKAQSEDQRRVIDLAELAIGRLRYEQDQLEHAIEAYQTVPSSSPLFDTALYEIAWVYIRMGDSTRAERALEVLSVAAPESPHIPDGQLLRGNLLLRDGNFKGATGVFEGVSAQFGPIRDELDAVLAQHEDVSAYFGQLVRDNLEAFDARSFLPPAALRWASVEGDMQRALDALSDLSRARRLVGETESIVARLNAALASPAPVNVFRDLRSDREQSTTLHNQLARARKDLATLDQASTQRYGSAELDQVRSRRLELERSLLGAPTGQSDLEKRTQIALKQYDDLAKELNQLSLSLLGMEARITATDRFMSDTAKGRETQAMEAVRTELSTQKSAISDYRKRIKDIGLQIETGRMQVGVGDQDSLREESLRKEYASLVERERQILTSLGARPDPQIDAAFQRLAVVEGTLDQHDRDVDAIVTERVTEMRTVLGEEGAKLTGYRTQLTGLESQSEEVVGGIALLNFRTVRQRFYDLVLRADVGIVDVSWAVREEHRTRGETLTRERARALQALEDEYKDIMDQQEGGQ